MKENTILKRELEDTRTTLEINKKIIYQQFASTLNEKDKGIVYSLQEENKRLTDQNNELFKEKIQLEKKLYKVQENLDDLNQKIQEMKDKKSSEIFLKENLLIEKENLIKQLKKELEKYYKEDFNSTKELLVCDPDKTNLEMNNELCEARELITKYIRMIHNEKKKSIDLEHKITVLNDKIQGKKKKKSIQEKIESIKVFDYILTDSDSELGASEDENENKSNFSDGGLQLESPAMRLPDKIKPKHLMTEMTEGKTIPKLDLSKVKNRHPPIKNIQVVDVEKNTNRSGDEYIDKLKFQIKYDRNEIIRLKKKVRDLKKMVIILKQNYFALKSNMTPPSTTDKSKPKSKISSIPFDNKKSFKREETESMEQNCSVKYDGDNNENEEEEEIVNFDDIDINYGIIEDNKNNSE